MIDEKPRYVAQLRLKDSQHCFLWILELQENATALNLVNAKTHTILNKNKLGPDLQHTLYSRIRKQLTSLINFLQDSGSSKNVQKGTAKNDG